MRSCDGVEESVCQLGGACCQATPVHCLTCQRISCAHHWKPCSNNGDSYFSVHALVHQCSEYDVGVGIDCLVNNFRCCIDLRIGDKVKKEIRCW